MQDVQPSLNTDLKKTNAPQYKIHAVGSIKSASKSCPYLFMIRAYCSAITCCRDTSRRPGRHRSRLQVFILHRQRAALSISTSNSFAHAAIRIPRTRLHLNLERTLERVFSGGGSGRGRAVGGTYCSAARGLVFVFHLGSSRCTDRLEVDRGHGVAHV